MGLVDVKEMRKAAEVMGLKEANPTVYATVVELSKRPPSGYEPLLLVDFEQFKETLLNNLGNTQTQEGVQRIFELFTTEQDPRNITLQSLRAVAKELDKRMSSEDLSEMLQRAASNGENITFEDFYAIMR